VTALADTRGTAHECPGLELIAVEGSYDATLAETLGRGPARRIGFEAAHLTVARHDWLQSTITNQSPITNQQSPIELIPTERVVERLRVRKDGYEIATLPEAARRLSLVATDGIGE